MNKKFNVFGFELESKKTILTLLISFAVLLVLIAVHLFWFAISWYGLLIGLGFIFAVMVSSALSKERGLYKDFSYDLVWLVFPLAIIGARLGYVLNSLDEFGSFAEIVGLGGNGLQGLSIFGGIAGGVVAVLIFAYMKKINPIKIMDAVVPGLVLAQSIGRWGNFFNQEVYGFEVTNKAFQWFPISVFIQDGASSATGSWHLATFFYESVLNLGAFFLLTILLRKNSNKNNGIVVSSYLVFYGVVRFILESLRVEQFILYIPGTQIEFSTMFSVLFIVAGLIGFAFVYLNHKKTKLNSK